MRFFRIAPVFVALVCMLSAALLSQEQEINKEQSAHGDTVAETQTGDAAMEVMMIETFTYCALEMTGRSRSCTARRGHRGSI